MGMKRTGEFELIERLCKSLPHDPRTILGPGDDCAILAPTRRQQLFTIDSMAEGVHFELKWLTPEQLGARALEVNLSDIAAMGGVARTCVVNLGIREGLNAAFFDRLYRGLGQSARRAGVDVVGGNITKAAQLTVTIALLGEVSGQALRRDTARVGDEIFVTGTLGDAALGWRIMAGKVQADRVSRKFLISRFHRAAGAAGSRTEALADASGAGRDRYQRRPAAGPRPYSGAQPALARRWTWMRFHARGITRRWRGTGLIWR